MRLILFLFFVAMNLASFADVYKWVDATGATHYGEKPPKGVKAQKVDTEAYGIGTDDPKECHSILCQGKKLEEERKKQAEQEAKDAKTSGVTDQATPVRGLDFKVFIQIHVGMSEGEVLVRAGKPDQEVTEGSETRAIVSKTSSRSTDPKTKQSIKSSDKVVNAKNEIVKTYYYLPTVSNPFTSIITFRGGRVANIERVKKF